MGRKKPWIEIPIVQDYLRVMRKFTKRFPLLNTLILVVGIILMWRGLYILADLYIFPNNYLLSAIISLLVGFIFLYYNDLKLTELI